MSSFFEKLIGGETAAPEKSAAEKPITKKAPKPKPVSAPVIRHAPEIKEAIAIKEELEEKEETEPTKIKKADFTENPEEEGQIAIDVYQTDSQIVVQAAIGGIKPADIEVVIENGIVQIKGSRHKDETISKNDYIIKECYWGAFSRQFVLPTEVDASRAEALLKDGVLTIKMPKINKERVTKLEIK